MPHLIAVPLFIGAGDGYLHTQMIVYYLVACLLGLLLGYLIWGWGRAAAIAAARAEGARAAERSAEAEGNPGEVAKLRNELEICTKARSVAEASVEKYRLELEAHRAGTGAERGAPVPEPEPTPVSAPPAELIPVPEPDPAPSPEPEPAEEPPTAAETVPQRLDAPRAGAPDNLRLIKGVGPKLEKTLNELGFYHFDQIAAWTPSEIAWVDSRLKFKGRIERDTWIDQARILAEGGETEFSQRKKT